MSHQPRDVSRKVAVFPATEAACLVADVASAQRHLPHARVGVFSNVLAIAFLLSFILPVSARTIGTKLSWILFGLWVVTVVKAKTLKSSRKQTRLTRSSVLGFGCLWLWVIIVAVNFVVGRGETGWIHMMVAVSMLMASIMGAFYGKLGHGSIRNFMFVLLVVLGAHALLSLPTLYLEDGIARNLMDPKEPEFLFPVEYALRGVGDYYLYTALAVLSPAFVGHILERKGFTRVFLVFWIVTVIGSIFIATFTAALIISMSGVTLTIMLGLKWQWRSGMRRLVLLTGLFVLVVAIGFILVGTLQGISQIERVRLKSFRLYENISALGLLEGDETIRASLAQVSLKTFIEAPFFGIGPITMGDNSQLYTKVGGHSSWLDQLAEYGLLGFGPFLLFLFLSIRKSIRAFRVSGSTSDAGMLSMAFCFLVSGLVNPVVFVESVSVPVCFLFSWLLTINKPLGDLFPAGVRNSSRQVTCVG